ncbi:N-methyl-L-tryptophan oxidase [Goodfellowiella coeruleoviolacea]|uniref:N-methyl-L-tryptophan oxidase n=1 Tax=Goodfellowiella coeruleoviolacea TaxID=334858 RepID=UPI0020A55284|nr:N-methyl-L-tryptophan oxidase [Goodfellowiella coeruleoviolacea]
MSTFDAIVIGLGGMGSAAAYQLARRGQRVLGLERFGPLHDRGSSHGGSRIIRQAYFEDPAYVPLLLRAYELWDEVERRADRRLVYRTGGLMIGAPDSRTVAGSRRSAHQWGLDHELLDAAEIRRRFPTLRPAATEVALYERAAGLVVPESGVAAHLRLASRAGAELHYQERVREWTADPAGSGVRVVTEQGVYHAGQLVVCPGAWAPRLLADLGVPLRVERQVQFWFAPAGPADAFDAERHPVYVWETPDGRQGYGVPRHPESPDACKVAFFRGGADCDPDTVDRTVRPEETAAIADFFATRVPDLTGSFVDARTCLYTSTPDEHFVIDRHPEHPQVVVACGFSGHGFKFVPVVGEILAELVVDGATRHPVGLFASTRFG